MQMARSWTTCSSVTSTARPILKAILRVSYSCAFAANRNFPLIQVHLGRFMVSLGTFLNCGEAQHHGSWHELFPNEAGPRAKVADAGVRRGHTAAFLYQVGTIEGGWTEEGPTSDT